MALSKMIVRAFDRFRYKEYIEGMLRQEHMIHETACQLRWDWWDYGTPFYRARCMLFMPYVDEYILRKAIDRCIKWELQDRKENDEAYYC